MGKRAVMWLGAAVVVVATFVVTSGYFHKRRPSAVPTGAVFLRDDGKDVWVACGDSDSTNMFHCSFYAPRTGELLSAMKYSLIQSSFPYPEKVTVVRHRGYESIETIEGTLVVYQKIEW